MVIILSEEGEVAEQLEFFPVQSPCRGICQSDERGFCRGCFRSRDERFNWNKMSDGEKQEVLRLCRQRIRLGNGFLRTFGQRTGAAVRAGLLLRLQIL